MAQSNRRRKRKNANGYLYIGITLLIVVAALFVAILCIAFGSCDEDMPADESVESVTESSTEESSQVITESSNEAEESSEPESVDPPLSPTEAYEKYIGVEYVCDMEEYEQYICPENEKDFVYLVNPSHTLPADYVPANLVKCTNIRKGRPESYSYMDATANKALEAFLIEARHYGFDDITVTNAYRSYKTQEGLFNNYVASDLKSDYKCDTCNYYIDVSYFPKKVKTVVGCSACGGELTEAEGENYCVSCMAVAEKAEIKVCADCGNLLRRPTKEETTAHVLTYSTRPGTSEHQSGLCCDMHNLPETTSKFDNTPEAIWLAENAHRFGFILRYPPNTQHITGIKHESWHFRYVGRTAATEIYERGITLDEYCAD
jgi:LAS superfamily LD-carboxypeptidase LdcB